MYRVWVSTTLLALAITLALLGVASADGCAGC
jgi:hypothetical protein